MQFNEYKGLIFNKTLIEPVNRGKESSRRKPVSLRLKQDLHFLPIDVCKYCG